MSYLYQQRGPLIQAELYAPLLATEQVVENLSARKGPLDVICWYEGTRGLSLPGAEFMRKRILRPLLQREETTLYLYSLKAWSFNYSVSSMRPSSIEQEINRAAKTNKVAIECFSSTSFFSFCAGERPESPLSQLVNQLLPQKRWLFELSEGERLLGKTVGSLFNEEPSLLSCLYKYDVAKAYSAMQYIEGYFLVRRAVERRLQAGKREFQIAFALPNDESKYYRDFPEEVQKMLSTEFGDNLNNTNIRISFLFFAYQNISDRPYLGKKSTEAQIKEEILELTKPL